MQGPRDPGVLGSPQVTMSGPQMSPQICLTLSFILLTCLVIWLHGKESAFNERDLGGEDPLEKAMATHSSILAGKSHGQRSLVGYSPWGHKESGD